MVPKSKEDKSEKIDLLPIMLEPHSKSKWVFAHIVSKKGQHPHAIKVTARAVTLSGYNRIMKSDQCWQFQN